MEAAVRRAEEQIASASKDLSRPPIHIPTLLNDELYQNCICVAVAPNASEGCCFRGLECTQFEVDGNVYNIAISRRSNLSDVTVASLSNDRNQQMTELSNGQNQIKLCSDK